VYSGVAIWFYSWGRKRRLISWVSLFRKLRIIRETILVVKVQSQH